MGYGSRTLKALDSFYSGEYCNVDKTPKPEVYYPNPSEVDLVHYFSVLLIVVILK